MEGENAELLVTGADVADMVFPLVSTNYDYKTKDDGGVSLFSNNGKLNNETSSQGNSNIPEQKVPNQVNNETSEQQQLPEQHPLTVPVGVGLGLGLGLELEPESGSGNGLGNNTDIEDSEPSGHSEQFHPNLGATPASAPPPTPTHTQAPATSMSAPVVPKFMLTKFTLYETKTKMYIVGSNARESRFRMLEIDLTAPKDQLVLAENHTAGRRSEIIQLLSNLEKDADSTRKGAFGIGGGLTKRLTAWAILGFIRFTEGYYMSVVTKRSVVALIGGHFIYHIEATELVPLVHSSVYRKPDRRSEEARYMATFQSLDLSRTFYFSNSYDITHTLQYNMIHEKEKVLFGSDDNNTNNLLPTDRFGKYNERFLWNIQLLEPVRNTFDGALDWCAAIIHGFIDQAKISVCGRSVLVTILARRSRYFAGARFLKRGVNDQGNVANEVETEQIVCDHLTTSFHDPQDGLFNCPRYSSYVQHRGSIPLYWSQDVSRNMSPKPPIELNAVDPFFSSAALHFDNMFRRYGSPLLILNLIKTRERVPRETKLLHEFEQCIKYLNQFLPENSKMRYTSWDMSRASKSRDQEVIEFLENYADATLKATGFFHNGKNLAWLKIQDGICRTNCIDCLDRTNAAQFVIGKRALGYQLHALGITNTVNIEYDSDVVNLLTEMYHDHGDTIALQYGGSHLVNTMETYRKINQWTSHSRDMIESIRRFYSNSFVDSQRQDAINLFLGNYVWQEGQPMLWDLSTDYYLHNDFFFNRRRKRSYMRWWIPDNLLSINDRLAAKITEVDIPNEEYEPLLPYREFYDNYWNEYYRPRLLTSLQSTFSYNMNSTLRYLPSVVKTSSLEKLSQMSPFVSRKPIFERRYSGDSNRGTGSSGKPSKGSSTSSSSSRHHHNRSLGGGSSIRKEAMKRASMIYQTPVLPRIFSGRHNTPEIGSKTETSKEEKLDSESNGSSKSVRKISSSSDSNTPVTSLNQDSFNCDIEKKVNRLLEPDVSSSELDQYNEYIKCEVCYETNTGNSSSSSDGSSVSKYGNFFVAPEDILSNLKIASEDYQTYEQYYRMSRSEDIPVTIVDVEDVKNSDSIYEEWLSLDRL